MLLSRRAWNQKWKDLIVSERDRHLATLRYVVGVFLGFSFVCSRSLQSKIPSIPACNDIDYAGKYRDV